jgi:hypothetical protein
MLQMEGDGGSPTTWLHGHEAGTLLSPDGGSPTYYLTTWTCTRYTSCFRWRNPCYLTTCQMEGALLPNYKDIMQVHFMLQMEGALLDLAHLVLWLNRDFLWYTSNSKLSNTRTKWHFYRTLTVNCNLNTIDTYYISGQLPFLSPARVWGWCSNNRPDTSTQSLR